MRILVFEPYYGGSHKAFLLDLARQLPFEFELCTLPARKWKWRMRFSAPYFVQQYIEALKKNWDCILCSTFVDVASLKGFLPCHLQHVPILTYYHENQFAYPVQVDDERDLHFALTNLTTAMASDRIAFNTTYNLETFLAGCQSLVKKTPDMKFPGLIDSLRAKSTMLPPAHDFDLMDTQQHIETQEDPVIVWNHRWEHDKDPDFFFAGLYRLSEQNVKFKIIVLGQAFERRPAIFEQAQKRLKQHIIHFGYAPSREEYSRLLSQGDVVVSSARHEFYGISVLEAVRCGCRPLLPNRLSYPGLFDAQYLYEDDDFLQRLCTALRSGPLKRDEARDMTERFSWNSLRGEYEKWLGAKT